MFIPGRPAVKIYVRMRTGKHVRTYVTWPWWVELERGCVSQLKMALTASRLLLLRRIATESGEERGITISTRLNFIFYLETVLRRFSTTPTVCTS